MKTEVARKAKNAWGNVRVGNALQLINGRAFKPSEWKERGLPIVRIQNLNNPEAPFNYYEGDLPEKFLLSNGDLLFAWSGTPGTSFGAHIWRGGKAWLNQHIFKVIFDEAEFDKRFLRLAINQNLNEYIQAAHGAAGLAHITKGKFEQSELVKPTLDEQRTIVAEIEKQFSRLDEAVASLKRTKANLKRYKAAVLKAAVEGKLTEDWRKQHPDVEPASKLLERIVVERRAKWNAKGKYHEPAAPETSHLADLPKTWMWASVESLSTKVVDGVHKRPNYVLTGVPFVTVRNLTAGPGISLSDLNYVTHEDHEQFIKRANPEEGDVLVSKDGTLGVIRVIKTKAAFSIFVSVALVKPVLKEMSDFLGWALSSPQVQVQMVPKGSGLQHIHLEDLRADCVPVPPLEEQNEIVAQVERRLSVIDELEATVEANLTRAERLRQSVLTQAFSGKLLSDRVHI